MSALYSFSSRLLSRDLSRLWRLLDGDEAQGERCARFAGDPDRPIDLPTLRPVMQHGEKIDWFAIGSRPSRIFPTCSHDYVSAGFQDIADAVRLEIGAIANADLSFDNRCAVESFAAFFIRQLEKTKTFARQVESTVNAP